MYLEHYGLARKPFSKTPDPAFLYPSRRHAEVRAGKYITLSVADTGTGMTPEVQQKLFEPFFTTKNARTTRGTGLGLSMIYAAAKTDELGLALETMVGKGTTFRVFIAVPIKEKEKAEVRSSRAVLKSEHAFQTHLSAGRDENAD